MGADEELGVGTAIEPPVEERRWVGDTLAFVSGGIAAACAWVGRRAFVAAPAVVLAVTPLIEEPVVEAGEPNIAAGVLVATALDELHMEEEPLIQSPRAKPQPKPAKQPTGPSGPSQPKKTQIIENAPSVQQLAELYTRTGRALKDASEKDRNATYDLWPRYRWVNFMDAIKTPQKRAAAAAVLEKLLADAKKLAP